MGLYDSLWSLCLSMVPPPLNGSLHLSIVSMTLYALSDSLWSLWFLRLSMVSMVSMTLYALYGPSTSLWFPPPLYGLYGPSASLWSLRLSMVSMVPSTF